MTVNLAQTIVKHEGQIKALEILAKIAAKDRADVELSGLGWTAGISRLAWLESEELAKRLPQIEGLQAKVVRMRNMQRQRRSRPRSPRPPRQDQAERPTW